MTRSGLASEADAGVLAGGAGLGVISQEATSEAAIRAMATPVCDSDARQKRISDTRIPYDKQRRAQAIFGLTGGEIRADPAHRQMAWAPPCGSPRAGR